MTSQGLLTCTCGNPGFREVEIALPTKTEGPLALWARICNSPRCNLVTFRTEKGEVKRSSPAL
jgi:hypothetical protein